jgi:nucleotide-binding universal stress UspA family protein
MRKAAATPYFESRGEFIFVGGCTWSRQISGTTREDAMFRHILVCTDGTKLSDKAVDAAIRLAKDVGARLTGFHATQEYPINPYPEYAMVGGLLAPEDWKADQEKRARRILDKVQARAKKAGVDCSIRHASDADPYNAIISAAKKSRCDLIVMASHGRRGLQGFVLGSETHKVLTHSKLPVLVYR